MRREFDATPPPPKALPQRPIGVAARKILQNFDVGEFTDVQLFLKITEESFSISLNPS
jgi:hypothetical protein